MLKRLLNSSEKENHTFTLNMDNIPNHVAIIMDGNGRWAKRRGLPRKMGHRAGADVLKKIVIAANDLGVKALTVYGFSTENWKRPEEEISLLMALIKEYLLKNVREMHEKQVRIRFIGHNPGLSKELQEIIADSEELTKDNKGLTLHLAINYGGRDEILRATKNIAHKLSAGELKEEELTEDYFGLELFTKEFKDVDLLIRPSNDFRISNFLLWQLAYAEFWFTEKHWPEFDEDVLREAIYHYQQRERRFGGLLEE